MITIQLSDAQIDFIENRVKLTQVEEEFLFNIRKLGNIVNEEELDNIMSLSTKLEIIQGLNNQ